MLDAVSPTPMGRKMKFPEKKLCSFPEGTGRALESVAGRTEDVTDVIREAVARELKRRGWKSPDDERR